MDVKKLVSEIVQKEFFSDNPEKLNGDTPLMSSGIIDSISALQLVEVLESTFNIEFEAHEVDSENLESVNTIISFLEGKRST